MDEWQIDLLAFLEGGGIDVSHPSFDKLRTGRFWICVALDRATRVVLAVKMAFKPNSDIALATFWLAMRNKVAISKQLGCQKEWSQAEDDYCLEGFNVLSSGPIALENCLEALRGRGARRRSYLSSDLGLFYSWLQSVDDQPEMQDILDCVHQFATRSYTMMPGKTVLGKAAPEIQRISFETARRQSGLGVALIRRLIAHVDLLSEAELAALRETTPAQLARAITFWQGLHNLTTTAQRLNIAPTQVTAMMELGLIGHIKFGTALRYAYAADVEQLLARVRFGREPNDTCS
ncbi:hypothetical protein [Thioclava sp. GXIMD4215]|uniref:hypothetical protein n=1 Tax=Thioclava sp. GXIMD4215 TaxID=3131928 RepID=UPI0032538EDB